MTDDTFNAQKAANYFLANVDEESGENISNLKLQKLLYYAQGFHIAMQGKSLFTDSILAWKHGPVVRPIWLKYKANTLSRIPQPLNETGMVWTRVQSGTIRKQAGHERGIRSAWATA